MKKILNSLLLLSIVTTSSFSANTEVLTKAMVKLISKQKTLENAIIVLKQNQNKQDYTISKYGTDKKEVSPSDDASNKKIAILNAQIGEIQKELSFAKQVNDIKIEENYKYIRNEASILKIDNFISSNR